MHLKNHTFRKHLIGLISFISFSINISGQQSAPVPNDTIFYSGIKKILVDGISEKDFSTVNSISWIPIKNDTSKWETFDINLDNQIDYSDYDKIIRRLASSSIVKAFESSMRTEDGRPVYCLEIGSGSKTVTFTAGIHAREVANPQFMLKFAARLVSDYEKGYLDIKDILAKNKVIILPCINPDGYETAINGNSVLNNKDLYISKCNNADVYQSKSNARGVDLNRNFPSYSGGLIWNDKTESRMLRYSPYIFYYSGASLGSENETKIAMNFLMKYIPLSRRYIDFHSAGRIIYAGKPHLSDAFNAACIKTGQLIKNFNNYRLLGLDDEETGSGNDGSITDFASEVAAGFEYNPKLQRLAPKDSVNLVKKTEAFKYPCSVNTVETLFNLDKADGGLLKPSTPQMHVDEWYTRSFYQLLLALIFED